MKSRKWNEDTLKLSKKGYVIKHYNSISLSERLRFIALNVKMKTLLPEEWAVSRMD